MSCLVDKEDQTILSLVEKCDKYAHLRVELAKKMSAGIFQLSQARKHGKLSLSGDDISREDFDARMFLDEIPKENNKDNHNGVQVVEEGDPMDSLMMFTALPPPSLRRAQCLFTEAVKIAVEMASVVRDIDLDLH